MYTVSSCPFVWRPVIPVGEVGTEGDSPNTCRFVTESESLLWRTSTRRPKWRKKSTPRMGCFTSAMMNTQRKRTDTVSCNVCIVDRLKTEIFLSIIPISAGGRHYTHFRTSINEKTKTSRTITYKEQATRVRAHRTGRHQRWAWSFNAREQGGLQCWAWSFNAREQGGLQCWACSLNRWWYQQRVLAAGLLE